MSNETYAKHLQAEREAITQAAFETSGLMNLITKYYVVGDAIYTVKPPTPKEQPPQEESATKTPSPREK